MTDVNGITPIEFEKNHVHICFVYVLSDFIRTDGKQ